MYEVPKKGGNLYPPKTLYQLCVETHRHLQDNGLAALEIFKSPDYKLFQDATESEMKNVQERVSG